MLISMTAYQLLQGEGSIFKLRKLTCESSVNMHRHCRQRIPLFIMYSLSIMSTCLYPALMCFLLFFLNNIHSFIPFKNIQLILMPTKEIGKFVSSIFQKNCTFSVKSIPSNQTK